MSLTDDNNNKDSSSSEVRIKIGENLAGSINAVVNTIVDASVNKAEPEGVNKSVPLLPKSMPTEWDLSLFNTYMRNPRTCLRCKERHILDYKDCKNVSHQGFYYESSASESEKRFEGMAYNDSDVYVVFAGPKRKHGVTVAPDGLYMLAKSPKFVPLVEVKRLDKYVFVVHNLYCAMTVILFYIFCYYHSPTILY